MTMLSNPRPHAIRLTLSDGSVRLIGPWGVAMLPESSQRGERLEITTAEPVVSGSTVGAASAAAGSTAADRKRAA